MNCQGCSDLRLNGLYNAVFKKYYSIYRCFFIIRAIFSGKWAAFLYAQFFAYIGILITCFIYYLLVKFGIEDGEAVLSMICCSILLGIALAIIGFILLKNFNLKKKILLWLKDAVELTAETIVLDSFRTFGHPFAETKLLVKFVYKRETITRTSEDKTKKYLLLILLLRPDLRTTGNLAQSIILRL